MRRTVLTACLAVLITLALAACGGSPHHHAALRAATGPTGATGHTCTPADEAMQCLLPPAPVGIGPSTTPVLQGVDFAWTKLAPAQAGSFAAGYLSHDQSKNWTRSLILAYHAARKGTVAVFEDSGHPGGCAQGRADAIFGEQLLASWGYPHSHEDLAIDYDATGPDVLPYFQCASAAEPGLIGAYGGYRPILYLYQHNAVDGLNWQTYAWSGGLWLPASIAPLEQWLNGSTFDHDRALAANYGQFPAPRPKPSPYAIFPARRIVLYGQKISERHTVQTWWAHKCENPPRREVCRSTRTHLTWLAGRLYTLALNRGINEHPAWGVQKPDWKPFHWGARHYRIERILHSKPRRQHR